MNLLDFLMFFVAMPLAIVCVGFTLAEMRKTHLEMKEEREEESGENTGA